MQNRGSFPCSTVVLLLGFGSIFFSSCYFSGKESLLVTAQALIDAGQHEKAFPLVREYLHYDAQHAGAHFLLGKCFASRTPPEIARAKGEFDTALALLETTQNKSSYPPGMTESEFCGALHHEMALILVRTALEAQRSGIPPRATLGVLRAALENVEKGLRYTPHGQHLTELQEQIQRFIATISEQYSLPRVCVKMSDLEFPTVNSIYKNFC